MATLGQVEEATLTANTNVSSRVNSTMGTLNSLDVEGAAAGAQVADNANNLIFKHGAYDFVGINEQGLEDMKNAVNSYITAVNEIIGEMVTTASPEGTFAGEYASTINEFITAIQSSCMNNVNALRSFNNDLEQVIAAMRAKDTSVSGSISEDAGSVQTNASSESY